jgi:MFS family permease
LAFFATFELGSLICGLATASKMLIVGRAIAGMGGAGMMNGAFTILSACAPAKQQPGKNLYICFFIRPLIFIQSFAGDLTPK